MPCNNSLRSRTPEFSPLPLGCAPLDGIVVGVIVVVLVLVGFVVGVVSVVVVVLDLIGVGVGVSIACSRSASHSASSQSSRRVPSGRQTSSKPRSDPIVEFESLNTAECLPYARRARTSAQ